MSLCMMRVGEACNPGPVSRDFVIGIANPSGVTGKTHSFLELDRGIWNIAETQCTDRGFRSFEKEIRAFQSPDRRLQVAHGAFAPPRHNSNIAGTWTGVAQLSDFPLRGLEIPWRGHEWTSGRTLVSSFHVDEHTVVGATIYAPPRGPTYRNAKALTTEMLMTITEELILGQRGPRFVAGDFNLDSHDLPTFHHWRALGWEEAQVFGLRRFGRSVQPTCKGSTTPDQLWLSPELQQWIRDVHTNDEVFADHATLHVTVTSPASALWNFHWHQPAVLPWDSVDSSTFDFGPQVPHEWSLDSMTDSFCVWSQQAELELVQQFGSSVSSGKAFRGRGGTTETQKRPISLTPIAPGRNGDIRPRSSLLGRQTHLWFKQLRRLQAFSQRASIVSPSVSVQVDQLSTWKNIQQAKGFMPSFSEWWLHRDHRLHGAPLTFPSLPPSAEVARVLFMDFQINFRSFERWHLRQRYKLIRAQHQHHNRLLYQQLKQQKAGSISHLQRRVELRIAVVHSATLVELDSPAPLAPSATWTLGNELASLTFTDDPTMVHVDSDRLLLPGLTLVGTWTLTRFEELEQELFDLWGPLWNRHAGLALSHWSRVLDFGQAFLPPGECDGPTWTSGFFHRVANTYKKKATRGPDGWDRNDLLALSPTRQEDVCSLFQAVEKGADWPVQLVTGFVCPVAKCSFPEAATQFRPIVLISLLYRMWASAASKHFLPYLCSRISPHIFGYVQGRRATDMWALLQMALETSRLSAQSLVGYCADLVKCFNMLPRPPLFGLLRHLGLCQSTLTAWTTGLGQLQRRFRLHHDVGPARLSCTGYPEGDPLSCLAMLAFNTIFDVYVKHFAPSCVPLAFVDNLQIVSDVASNLQHGYLVVETFLESWDLNLDPDKSYAWAILAKQRAALRAFGHRVLMHQKDLGSQMHYAGTPSRQVLRGRLADALSLWSILRASSAPSWFRKLAIRTAIWPKLLHSCESAWISATILDSLRSKCLFALKWDRAGANPILRWALMLPSVGSCLSSIQGLFHSVHSALDLLGWVLDDSFQLHLDGISLSWLTLSLESLRLLVGHFWQQHMCTRLGSRKDLEGLTSIDVDVSFGSYRTEDLGTAELVATIQDGSFYTHSAIAKFDASKSATCSQCGVEDTVQHRCLVCPKYASIRAEAADVLDGWTNRPRYFNEHGLMPCNPFLLDHWINLLQLPDVTETFHCHPDEQ
eukprot:Skav220967  [mRNA]  locus=scaffold1928:399017:402731:+ [translate_table: standard]